MDPPNKEKNQIRLVILYRYSKAAINADWECLEASSPEGLASLLPRAASLLGCRPAAAAPFFLLHSSTAHFLARSNCCIRKNTDAPSDLDSCCILVRSWRCFSNISFCCLITSEYELSRGCSSSSSSKPHPKSDQRTDRCRIESLAPQAFRQ